MFTVEARDELRHRVVEMARKDRRVVAAAEVGSLSAGEGDRWSDVDLTFAIDDTVEVVEVLEDWTLTLADAGAVVLFDLPAGPSIYRVYMFPECLQLDLSFSAVFNFRPTSPRFRLIFGEAGEMAVPEPPSAATLLGWAIMWARHARVSIERKRWWQAEHAISSMRERALDLACRRRGLPAGYGRGLEQLPTDARDRFAGSLVSDFQRDELIRALKDCVAGLAAECAESAEIDEAACDRLLETVAGI